MRTPYQRLMDVWGWIGIGLFALCFVLMLIPAARTNGLFHNTFNVMICVLASWRLVVFVYDNIVARGR